MSGTIERELAPDQTRGLAGKTIYDFGEQWQAFRSNEGYYASAELFADILGPLIPPSVVIGRRAADIGSGTGRIVQMLLDAGAAHVTAIEPSACFPVLRANLVHAADRVTCLNVTGDQLPPGNDLDFVFSIGVMHHIPDPLPTLRAAFSALRPGGRLVIWVYGREGNGLYLGLARPLRALTTFLPHGMLLAASWAIWPLLAAYILACRLAPLPMRRYMLNHIARLSVNNQVLTIYDQLNPAYARYYRGEEVRDLLGQAGFTSVGLYHRHGYSWTAVGTRPGGQEAP